MATKKIDFGKCKNFDELCGLLNMFDFHFSWTEGNPDDADKLAAIEPYFEDEESGE